MGISDNEKWLISFYRNSEITGALFFGRLAQYISHPEVKRDLTKHFADESMHGWYWTNALEELGAKSMRNFGTYQDKYFEEIGAPMNLMEILSITHIFEQRVINQYKRHLEMKNINPVIESTLKTIMADEGWHLVWVSKALKDLEEEYGKEAIDATLERYRQADNEIFGKFCEEHEERIQDLFGGLGKWRI